MGVAGSGKSSVGIALAQLEGATYIDGDTLHPAANLQKMSAGIPLSDDDRQPWLIRIAEILHVATRPTLIGCSALKRRYRDLIRAGAGGEVLFIHLTGPRDVIAGYMQARTGHFMPPSLLDSQYATLEPLQRDEKGFDVSVAQPLDAVVAEAKSKLDQSNWRSAS